MLELGALPSVLVAHQMILEGFRVQHIRPLRAARINTLLHLLLHDFLHFNFSGFHLLALRLRPFKLRARIGHRQLIKLLWWVVILRAQGFWDLHFSHLHYHFFDLQQILV